MTIFENNVLWLQIVLKRKYCGVPMAKCGFGLLLILMFILKMGIYLFKKR